MTCKWCLINGNFISLYNSRLCHSIHLLWMDMLICLMCLSIIAGFLLVHDIHYQQFFNTANVFSHSPINNVNLLISGFSTSVFINASSIPQNFPTTNSTVLSNSMAAEHGINLTSLCPSLNIDNCTETYFKGSSNKLQSRYSHKATNR